MLFCASVKTAPNGHSFMKDVCSTLGDSPDGKAMILMHISTPIFYICSFINHISPFSNLSSSGATPRRILAISNIVLDVLLSIRIRVESRTGRQVLVRLKLTSVAFNTSSRRLCDFHPPSFASIVWCDVLQTHRRRVDNMPA